MAIRTYQTLDADLTAIAALTPANDDFIQRKSGVWVNRTVAQVVADLGITSGAPDTADYLVGTAQGGLSAEIVVGTTPQGELGGTWGSPTVDATHSGSTHAGAASAAVATHEGLSDPHTGYRLESADHSHATTGLQAGQVAHSALSGIAATDHHVAPAAGPDADDTVDAAGAAGTASTFARSGHGHKVATDSGVASTQAFGDSATAGTSGTIQRQGHKHAMPANPVTGHEAAGDPHTGYRLESADHTHASSGIQAGQIAYSALTGTPAAERAAASTTPAAIGTAAVGVGTTDARADHVHATGAGTPSTQAFGDAAATGTGPAASMTDHKHAMPADPVTAHAAAGDPHTGYRLESADHTHATTGLQAGTLDHGLALTGLTDDDHTQYLKEEASGGVASEVPDHTHVSAAQAGAIKLDALVAPDDVTTLDASTSAHGLMKKYPGGTTTFLRADGSFAAPTASVAFTEFTKDLGAARQSGTFDITGLSGLTADKPVEVFQTAAPIASKGNARDEIEADPITLTGYVVNATTVRCYWVAPSVVVGTYAFAYLIGA